MKEDKAIDKLIRESFKMEQPSDDFTHKIMGKIEAVDMNEEKALKSILKNNTLESPSLNFTARVMAEVEKASVELVNPPIINNKAWIFISLFIGSIFVFSFLGGERKTNSPNVIDGALEKFDQVLTNSLTFELPEILTSPLFGLSLFALSSLLFLDYYLKNKKVSVNI